MLNQERKTTSEILHYILYVLFKRKMLSIFVFFATLVFVIFGTFLISPTWEGTTLLLVERNMKQQLPLFRDMFVPGGPMPGLSNEAENFVLLLTGKSMAYEIVEEFHLDRLSYQKAKEPKLLRDKIKSAMVAFFMTPLTLAQHLGWMPEGEKNWIDKGVEDLIEDWEDVEVEEGTQVISLTIHGETQTLAMEIANSMANKLLERTQTFSNMEADNAYDFVMSQIRGVEEKLKAAENAIRLFKQKNSLVNSDTFLKIHMDKIETLENQLSDLKAKKAAMLVDKREEHPDVKAVTIEIFQRISELENQKAGLKEAPALEEQLNQLIRNKQLFEATLIKLKTKLQENEILRRSRINEYNVRVLDPAFVSSDQDPDWPIWPLNIIAGIFVGILFSLGLPFLIEYWNDRIRFVEDLDDMNLPSLGTVPILKK